MAISVKCKSCSSTVRVDAKKCPKCGSNLNRRRVYRVRVRVGTKWRTKQVSTLNMAKRVEAKFKTDAMTEGELGLIKAPYIDEAWKILNTHNQAHLKHPGTYEKNWETHIKPVFTGRRLDEISPLDVERFTSHLRLKPRRLSPLETKGKQVNTLAPATVCRILATLKRIYSFAEKMGVYQGLNPTRHITMPKFDNRMTNVLTRDELKRLVNILTTWENRLPALGIHMALMTGKRMGEVFGLTWDRVDWEAQTVSYITKSQTHAKKQTLPMNAQTLAILREAQTYRRIGQDLVFHTSEGKRIHYRAIWQRIKENAKLSKRFRAHDLRHTFASYLASSGEVDIYTLQNLLGHETIAMTQRYSHLLDGRLKEAVEVADKVLVSIL